MYWNFDLKMSGHPEYKIKQNVPSRSRTFITHIHVYSVSICSGFIPDTGQSTIKISPQFLSYYLQTVVESLYESRVGKGCQCGCSIVLYFLAGFLFFHLLLFMSSYCGFFCCARSLVVPSKHTTSF